MLLWVVLVGGVALIVLAYLLPLAEIKSSSTQIFRFGLFHREATVDKF
jgi:hypothetical protein